MLTVRHYILSSLTFDRSTPQFPLTLSSVPSPVLCIVVSRYKLKTTDVGDTQDYMVISYFGFGYIGDPGLTNC